MINRLLKLLPTRFYTFHHIHTSIPILSSLNYVSESLSNRGLLKVSGPDSVSFLQGMVTADVSQLTNQGNETFDKAIYSMILNSQGRVLYDVFLYRIDELFKKDFSILIECEKNLTDEITNYLKKYKIRKKLQFYTFNDFSTWVIMKNSQEPPLLNFTLSISNTHNATFCQPDPRLPWLCQRLLLPVGMKASDVVEQATTEATGVYRQLRYEHGVAEGRSELPSLSTTPLEANLHFLKGVSFSKGCYVGQELTARTHHTGVIRKRIMPLSSKQEWHIDSTQGDYRLVQGQGGKECGRLRAWQGSRGLALLRLQECLLTEAPLLLVKKASPEEGGEEKEVVGEVNTHVPEWWPVQQDEVVKAIVAKMARK